MSYKCNSGVLRESTPGSWIWEVSGQIFREYFGNNKAVESPLIKIQSDDDGREFVWALRYYCYGKAGEENDKGSVKGASVQLVSLNTSQVWMKFRFTIRRINSNELLHAYDTGPRGELFLGWGCERGESYIIHQYVHSWNISDLSISFDIYDVQCKPDEKQNAWIYRNRCKPIQGVQSPLPASDNDRSTVENEINSSKTRESNEKSQNGRDNECEPKQDEVSLKFIHDKKFGDIQIKVQGKKFRAHRTLLSSQSKVLAEILGDNETDEKKSISIDDISDRVFMEILRFVYYQEVQGVEKHAKDFFATAVKYSMHSFKRLCEETVSKNVNSENAIEYLKLADHFELEELRKYIVEFVASNFTTIAQISSIASLKNMKSDSLFGLIQAMATNMSGK